LARTLFSHPSRKYWAKTSTLATNNRAVLFVQLPPTVVDYERREKIALATSPIASTLSPQSEKQTIRHGHASNPS
jgi:hypothetical protein